MKAANLSPWTNKWNDVYDFTPHRKADDGSPNFTVSKKVIYDFVSPLEKLTSLVKRVSQAKGVEITSLEEIKAEDILQIKEFDEDVIEQKDLGKYFSQYNMNMLTTIPPSKAVKSDYTATCFLLAFVKDHAGIYDTLMYKLLAICGTHLIGSKGKKKTDWIEETRSTLITIEEKHTLLKAIDDGGKEFVAKIGDSTNMMAIGIEFRSKNIESMAY